MVCSGKDKVSIVKFQYLVSVFLYNCIAVFLGGGTICHNIRDNLCQPGRARVGGRRNVCVPLQASMDL